MLPRIGYASALPGATWFLARPCSSIEEIISERLLADLRDMKAGAPVDEPLLQRHLRELCAEAIRCGIRSEQVVVGLKEQWRTLPTSLILGYPSRDANIWSALVASVLDAYYGANVADR
jgi:hypothetical protein